MPSAFSYDLLVFHCLIFIQVTGLVCITFLLSFYLRLVQHAALLAYRLALQLLVIKIQGAQNQLLEEAHVKGNNIRVNRLVR